MLYKIKIYKDPYEYWFISTNHNWDAWYLIWNLGDWKNIVRTLKSYPWKCWGIAYEKNAPTNDFIHLYYTWYDGPIYSLWIWRFNICLEVW